MHRDPICIPPLSRIKKTIYSCPVRIVSSALKLQTIPISFDLRSYVFPNIMASPPTSPIAGVKFPISNLTSKAFAYVQEHNTPTVANHVMRSTLFALTIAQKVPPFAGCDAETTFLATAMHDLGWSSTPSLISKDKRFEVDGANAAREFIKTYAETTDAKWTEQRVQLIWDAIALHTSPSISLHGQPGVAVVTYGIMADFFGPKTPGGVITVDEFKEVVKAYPRLDFEAELKKPPTACAPISQRRLTITL